MRVIRVSTLDDLPAEAVADKKFYRNLGIRSILIVPIMIEGSARYMPSPSLPDGKNGSGRRNTSRG